VPFALPVHLRRPISRSHQLTATSRTHLDTASRSCAFAAVHTTEALESPDTLRLCFNSAVIMAQALNVVVVGYVALPARPPSASSSLHIIALRALMHMLSPMIVVLE
jgi:hypothetical protein